MDFLVGFVYLIFVCIFECSFFFSLCRIFDLLFNSLSHVQPRRMGYF